MECSRELKMSDTFKKSLYKHFAQVAKALSNGYRLEIIELLAQCEYSVDALADLTGLSVANTSHHLQQLKHAGLVNTRKKAQWVYYQVSNDDVLSLVASLRQVSERHIEAVDDLVNGYLHKRDSLEPVRLSELRELLKTGRVTLIDVRPESEYRSGHVVGAANFPLNKLKYNLDHLDQNREIVAYCRGPFCVLAFDAVRYLRKKGFVAHRLEGGFPEWYQAGLPVEAS